MQFLQITWFVFCLSLALLIIRQSRFFYHRSVHPLFFELAFLLKVAAGLIMTWIYTHFYTDRSTADIFKYFDDSGVMWQALEHGRFIDFFKMLSGIDSANNQLDVYYRQMISWDESDSVYNDSRIVIRINALIRFFSFGDYYIHMLFICLATLTGLTGLFHVLAKAINEKFILIFSCVFLWPSVIFWYSGMLKDGLLITALGIFLFYFFNSPAKQSGYRHYLLLFISGWALLFIKTYIVLMILPGLLMVKYFEQHQKSWINVLKVWILVYVSWFIAMALLFQYGYGETFTSMLANKQQSFIQLAKEMHAGSYFEIPAINDFQSIIQNAPVAFCNVMFRPWLSECRSPLMLMAFSENMLMILTAVYTAVFRNKHKTNGRMWILFAITFTVLLFVLIGLVVPVTGAIVRYRITALPFLSFIMIVCVDKEKAKTHLRFFRIIK